jgi:trans-aconitate methyltransferase
VWDRQYRSGDWDALHSLDQLGHHALLAAYVGQMFPHAAVLEAGCGSARLLQLLKGFGIGSYHGLDLSEEAIRRARGLGIEGASFEVADFDRWQPPRRYDAIVFTEVLYYAPRPVDTVRRYVGALEQEGAFFVSMHRSANHGLIWKKLEDDFEIVCASSVENRRGDVWDVRVLRPAAG